METKTYFFRPDKKFKQGYILTDNNKEMAYEAKMTKFTLFLPFKFQFINHITGKSEEHKVSHTVTMSETGLFGGFSTKSSFKFDGKKIWDYLHDLGVRIDSHVSVKSIGMSYDIKLKGVHIANISTASATGKKSFLTNDVCYNIETSEDNLDIAFLLAFAFARTEQAFYD